MSRPLLPPVVAALLCCIPACGDTQDRAHGSAPGRSDAAPAGAAGASGAGTRNPLRFDECAAAAGLTTPQVSGGDAFAQSTILEVNGSGGALADLDGDGRLDLVLVQGSTSDDWLAGRPVEHLLYRNRGPRDGLPRFERVLDSGLVMTGWPTGISCGDVDRDGAIDLVVGGLGEDALFLNRTTPGGPPRFLGSPLPGRDSPLDWTTSLSLGDGDGDGLLDLYLVRYLRLDPAAPPLDDVGGVPCRYHGLPVLCGPQGLQPQPDVYLRGLAGPPWFEPATAAAGLAATPSYGLGVLFTDLDLDGDLDLYVANDSVDNRLFRNEGQGRFHEIAGQAGVAADAGGRPQAGMGVASGDVDEDGDLDLVVTNFAGESNALYRQDAPWQFREVSGRAGLAAVSRPLLGWGVLLDDFDADGHLDLAVANGHVYPQADEASDGAGYAQPLQLLPGHGDATFGPDSFSDGSPQLGRTLLGGDLDGDGDTDLVLLRLDATPLLYVNRQDTPMRHLLVDLAGAGDQAPDAFGAALRVLSGQRTRVLPHLAASGFQGQNDPRLHLVLPPGEGLTAAEVLWPGGAVEALDVEALRPGQLVFVEQGRGVVASQPLESVP